MGTGIGCFYGVKSLGSGWLGHGCLIGLQSAHKVGDVPEPMSLQYVGGQVAPQSHTAEQPQGAVCRYLLHPLPEVVQRNVPCTGEAAQGKLIGRTYVNKYGIL